MASNYQQQIMEMRQARNQRETNQRLEEMKQEYAEAQQERDLAAQRGDREGFELFDDDCQRIEENWRAIAPPPRPQQDPRLTEFIQRNARFWEKYGAQADRAIIEADAYMTRPRNPNSTHPKYNGMGMSPHQRYTPEYFERMKDLLELHGRDLLGVTYDRNEEELTATEAAKISDVSPSHYNKSAQTLWKAGRLGQQKK